MIRWIRTCTTLMLFAGVLSACQAFNQTDTVGTLEAENMMYATDAIVLETESWLVRTQVVQTVQAQETEVAIQNSINRQLLTTVESGSTPTTEIVAGSVDGRSNFASTPFSVPGDGETQFELTGLSQQVYASDGCIVSAQSTFPTTAQRVYATLRAYNIAAGTLMEADWYRQDTLVQSDSWTVDANYDQICIWFFIRPSDVPFTEGRWSVQLSADGSPLQQPLTFSFIDGTMDDGMMDG